MSKVYTLEGEVFESFEKVISSIKSGYANMTEVELQDYVAEMVTEHDTEFCDHPAEFCEYDSRLASLATYEQPAEHYEWFTCKICGESDNL